MENPNRATPLTKVLIGIPCSYNQLYVGTMSGIRFCARTESKVDYAIATNPLSILTRNFNSLYATALNARKTGVTHFAMMHADIGPEADWLGKMLRLMSTHEADILSVIVPIKDPRGLTSTALDEPVGAADPKWRVRRLTLHEVHESYPPTFTKPNLLLNSGLMVVDLRHPSSEKLVFRFEDDIIKIDDEFQAVGISEDWYFSRLANSLGMKLFATREVHVTHHGTVDFTNDKWGSKRTDD